jgi:hypothetical protein
MLLRTNWPFDICVLYKRKLLFSKRKLPTSSRKSNPKVEKLVGPHCPTGTGREDPAQQDTLRRYRIQLGRQSLFEGLGQYSYASRQLRTLDEMRIYKKDDAQVRWKEIEQWLTEDLEDAWDTLRNCRTDDAHPTLTDEDEDPPTPDQLKQAVRDVFKSSKKTNMRRQAESLIDILDTLSRAQHVDILK